MKDDVILSLIFRVFMKIDNRWVFRLTVLIMMILMTRIALADSPPPPKIPPTAVVVIIAKPILWESTLKETGTLVAEHGLVVKSEVAGRISKLFFKSGQTIHANDPLVQLNPDVLEAQLKQNEAELHLDELAFERNKGLAEKKVVSVADYDQVLANYQSAQAKVAGVEAELNQLLIRAPFAGKLGLQQINIGDYVDAGTPIVNLQSVDPIYVDFSVAEINMDQIKLGQLVTVQVTAYPSQKVSGHVIAMESLINPDTRTLMVRAILPNSKGNLIPGAFVEVQLSGSQRQRVIAVPETALLNTAAGPMTAVYVVKNNQAVLTKVTLIKQRRNDVLVNSGLKAGDQIVIFGQMKLQNHTPVTVTKIIK